ncbi:dihydrodipicolinate reductase [Quadrisphaera granulorum]|uniref:4-hydroxy-tetrahydrodipicolinate reductase n=1 Tax=Quadrisphaera granulorum TaxID=317664 RepID=A0A316AFA7_9ACTN|nr:dihydrodipicolinate reductase [Quadrisphaera granulorum]SZE95099.1 dihydrodipicolinate reductase [Quadrisphaera granulorum]
MIVVGAGGKMGRMACDAVESAPDLQLVARAGRSDDPAALAREAGAQVAVDLSVPSASPGVVAGLVAAGVHVVVGTSGWDEAALGRLRAQLDEAPAGTGVVVVPNFAIGAVLMVRFAEAAARWFTSVEVIEAHHPAKVDAPSGTAVRTAELIAAARRSAGTASAPDATTSAVDGARGADVEGVPVHSLRMAGVMAAQEVWLGNHGEMLTLRHEATDRTAYAPGLLLAVREVASRPGLTVGLEHLLGV